MNDIENRARELLASAYADTGAPVLLVDEVRRGENDTASDNAAIRAIIAALTPPEGYVLVPVNPTGQMLMVGHRNGGQQVSCGMIWEAMVGARPEPTP